MAKLGKWLAGSLALLLGMAAGYWNLRNGESTAAGTRAADTAAPRPMTHDQEELPTSQAASRDSRPEAQPQPRLAQEPVAALVEAGPFKERQAATANAAQRPHHQEGTEAPAFITLPPGTERWRYDDADGLTLPGHDFRGADLEYVDLSHADLRRGNFKDANLTSADLRGANLRNALFENTRLIQTDLRGAVLQGATIEAPVGILSADLRRADLRDADFTCRKCTDQRGYLSLIAASLLNDADLRGVDFGRIMVVDSTFDGADLRGADLSETEWATTNSVRGARYNRHTRLPARCLPTSPPCEFKPEDRGMIYMPEEDEEAPPH